jgi:hypothetical protein
VPASTSHLGTFEHPEFYKSFLNNTAHFFRGEVFLIKVVGHGYVYKVCELFQRNDIVFIRVVLGQRKWRLQQRNWCASQILRAVKRIEALKIQTLQFQIFGGWKWSV